MIVTPTSPKDRILLIDVIRGFALFGILLVNAPSINSLDWMDTVDFTFETNQWGGIIGLLILSLVEEKFYPIFSFLFGLSAITFMENAQSKNLNPRKLFVIRLVGLFIFGWFHMAFVWWGDILLIYSVLGIFLIFFYSFSAKRLLFTALLILSSLMILHFYVALPSWSEDSEQVYDLTTQEEEEGEALEALEVLDEPDESDESDEPDEPDEPDESKEQEKIENIYQTGTFWQITSQRLQDYYYVFFWDLFQTEDLDEFIFDLTYYVHIFAIFLLGGWAHKRGLFRDIKANWHIIFPTGLTCLIIGVISSFLEIQHDFWEILLFPIYGLSLGLGYVFILVCIYQTYIGKKLLKPLASIGQMSLSNYISANLIFSLLYYGYGFGLYGKISPGVQLCLIFIVFFSLMGLSILWLRYFQFGPLEYLWRQFTYNVVRWV